MSSNYHRPTSPNLGQHKPEYYEPELQQKHTVPQTTIEQGQRVPMQGSASLPPPLDPGVGYPQYAYLMGDIPASLQHDPRRAMEVDEQQSSNHPPRHSQAYGQESPYRHQRPRIQSSQSDFSAYRPGQAESLQAQQSGGHGYSQGRYHGYSIPQYAQGYPVPGGHPNMEPRPHSFGSPSYHAPAAAAAAAAAAGAKPPYSSEYYGASQTWPADPELAQQLPQAYGAGFHGMLAGQQQMTPPKYSGSARSPALVRTSALTQARTSWNFGAFTTQFEGQVGSGMTSQGRPREQAQLIIDGNLDLITKDWDVDETMTSRRLVLFERVQDGSQIRLKFHTISRQDYDPQSTVISCIYWKEREQYYVTSVDCITLLELIINQKFTVEEKNRVRRNLEVCKPLTVSKSKNELSSFFRLIMKFEAPRPRNIEKDVKVFPWSMLGNALTKIVSKYSASYNGNDMI